MNEHTDDRTDDRTDESWADDERTAVLPAAEPGTPTSDTASERGTHPMNIAHLVMGIAFILLVAVWALVVGDVVRGSDVRWLLPLPWLAAGGAGLVATTLRGRARMAR